MNNPSFFPQAWYHAPHRLPSIEAHSTNRSRSSFRSWGLLKRLVNKSLDRRECHFQQMRRSLFSYVCVYEMHQGFSWLVNWEPSKREIKIMRRVRKKLTKRSDFCVSLLYRFLFLRVDECWMRVVGYKVWPLFWKWECEWASLVFHFSPPKM